MKRVKILYRLVMALIMVFTVGLIVNSEMDSSEKAESFAFATIIGSIAITKESDTAGKVVFDKIIEDWNGGAALFRARLQTGTTQIPKGTFLYITAGQAEIIKTATGIAGGTATVFFVNKTHQFKVGEHIMITSASTAQTITVIDTTTSADHDIITIATTMGTTVGAGTVIVEAAAQGATPDPLYVANAISKDTVDVTRANPSVSGVVRGSVRSNELPYGAYVDDIAALSLIRFV